jgi:XTP/dITP diphosphohydrolase
MIEVVLATSNKHKVVEVQRIVDATCKDISVIDLSQWTDAPEVIEDGATFAANALLKARTLAAHTGMTVIADDSGICVDALNGMPGIFSARWAGSHGDDKKNLNLLLDQIVDVPDTRRGAQFVCAFAVVTPDGIERVVEGVVDGEITRTELGTDGFGYDPIFMPYGFELTTAQMSPEQKDEISHRGQAVRNLVPVLKELFGLNQGCGGNCACRAN